MYRSLGESSLGVPRACRSLRGNETAFLAITIRRASAVEVCQRFDTFGARADTAQNELARQEIHTTVRSSVTPG